jgi:hypothetical protein
MLIADASDEKSLAYVAAGPLEDLLHKHGDVVIDRVELHARTDPKFRLALTGVGDAALFSIAHAVPLEADRFLRQADVTLPCSRNSLRSALR